MTDCGDISIEIPGPAGIDERGLPFWTGRQLFSTILPEDFNATFRARIAAVAKKDAAGRAVHLMPMSESKKGFWSAGPSIQWVLGTTKAKFLDA